MSELYASVSHHIHETLATFDELEFIAFENLIAEGIHPDRMVRFTEQSSSDRGFMVDGAKACVIGLRFDGRRMMPHWANTANGSPTVTIQLTWLGSFMHLGYPRGDDGQHITP